MSESRVGVRVAVTRQNAGRLPSEAGLGTVTGGPGGIVNGPGATGAADVMAVFASVKVSRLSHVAAADGRAAPIVAIVAIASESLVLDVIRIDASTAAFADELPKLGTLVRSSPATGDVERVRRYHLCARCYERPISLDDRTRRCPHRVRGVTRAGPGRFHRGLASALSRGLPGEDSRARPRRLPGPATERRGAPIRRQLAPRPHHAAGGAVPRPRVAVYLSGSGPPDHLAGAGSDDSGARRVPAPRQHLRPGPDDLPRRPRAPVAVRAPHVDGLFDRDVGRREAHGHDHASEEGMAPAQRGADERPGDVDGAFHPQRRRAHPHQHRHRSRLPHRAAGQERGLRPPSRRPGDARLDVQLQGGGGSGPARRRRAAIPARRESVPRRLPQALPAPGGRDSRRRRDPLSRVRRQDGYGSGQHRGAIGGGAAPGGRRHRRGPQDPGQCLPARDRRRQHGAAGGRPRRARRRHAGGRALRQNPGGHPDALGPADPLHHQHAVRRRSHRRQRGAGQAGTHARGPGAARRRRRRQQHRAPPASSRTRTC